MRSRTRGFVLLFFAVLLCLVSVISARAMRACGDDVDGHGTAVPCACGDMLVSSRTLSAADHITHESCPGMGLLVAATGRVTLGFDGHTVRGQGQGIGVFVTRGSLSLRGPGTIEGFGTGALARGPNALASAIGMRFVGNRMYGLYAESDGYAVQGNVAENNGHDGFALAGNGYAVDGNRAAGNQRYGFYLLGMGAHVGSGLGNEAVNNGKSGFWVYGMMQELAGATAVGNGDHGVYAMVWQGRLADIRAEGNVGDGIHAMGMALALERNTATANQGYGVWATGEMFDDRGGNWGADNAGLTGEARLPSMMLRETAPTLVQCRIGAAPCR